jgi:integrative and conjugative element protein (TIGR02256 family)
MRAPTTAPMISPAMYSLRGDESSAQTRFGVHRGAADGTAQPGIKQAGSADGNRCCSLSHNGRFYIATEASATMLGFLQHGPRRYEAGGVLIGRHLIGSEDIIVDRVTTPMRGDKRSRFSFYRAHKRHQRAVGRAWNASRGVYTYLGEWHTHAEPVPSPSGLDERERIRILETAQCSHPIFFVVLGRREHGYGRRPLWTTSKKFIPRVKRTTFLVRPSRAAVRRTREEDSGDRRRRH